MRRLACVLALAVLGASGCSKAVWNRGGLGRNSEFSVERYCGVGAYPALYVAPAEVEARAMTEPLRELETALAEHARGELVRAVTAAALFETVTTEETYDAPRLLARVSIDFGGRKEPSGFDAGNTIMDATAEIFVPGKAEPVVTFDATGLGITCEDAAEGPKLDLTAFADRFALELARYAHRHGRHWSGGAGERRPSEERIDADERW